MSDEMLLTLGAIVLLSIFVLSSNTVILNNDEIIQNNEFAITAISIGQSLIDEAKLKEFDKISNLDDVSKCTNANELGPELGEKINFIDKYNYAIKGFASDTCFHDFDDYNGYNRIVNTPRLGNYRVKVEVKYADEINPDPSNDPTSGTKTFCKRMEVYVWNTPYIDSLKPIKLYYAMTYHH